MSVIEEPSTYEKNLKRVRAGYLANATRKLNEFHEAHLTGDKREEQSTLDSLRKAYKDFIAAHEQYLQTKPPKEDSIRAADQYSELMSEMLKAEHLVSQRQSSKRSTIASSQRSKASYNSIKTKARLVEAEVRKQFLLEQQALERHAAQIRRQKEETEHQVQLLAIEQEIAVAKELVRLEEESQQSVSSNSSQILQDDFQSNVFPIPQQHGTINNNTPKISEFKDSKPTPPNNDQNSLQTLTRLLRQTPSLPQLEMIKFSGDPAHFAEFYTTFHSNIEIYVENNTERLIRLIASCTGKAAEAIRSCVNLPPNTQYQTAWTTLKENFGQPHMVFEAQIARLKTCHFKRADAETLLDFSRRLEEAQRVLHSLGPDYSDRLNNDDLIKMLIRKLPEDFQRRWIDKVGYILTNQSRIKFQDFVNFVKRQGQTLNNTYGAELLKPKPFASKVMTVRSAQRLACAHCSGQHPVWSCDSFKRIPLGEKLKTVYKAKLCKRCLKGNHFQNECRSNFKCKTCGKFHNTLLHAENKPSPQNSTQSEVSLTPSNSEHYKVQSAAANCRSRVWLKVVPVIINGKIKANAFLDSGSDTSLCSTSLLEKIGFNGGKIIKYTVSTVSGEREIVGKRASLRLQSLDKATNIVMQFLSTDFIPIDDDSIAQQHNLNDFEHLREINLPEPSTNGIDILIGSDYADVIETQTDIKRGKPGEPIAIKTLFGWTVSGTSKFSNTFISPQINFLKTNDNEVTDLLHKLYDQEFSDINSYKNGLSLEDQRALQIMSDSAILKNGHYQIKMPFRSTPTHLTGNFQVAYQRLLSLKRRFQNDVALKEQYTAVLDRYITEGACAQSSDNSTEDRWFLPHHAVSTPNKPKTRVVFDCAAQYKGKSLNSELLKGPDNTNLLIEVLLRFRVDPIAVTADIKSMFHQVKVPPEDSRKLSFLWWPDGNIKQEPAFFEMKAHLFGATSSPSVCEYALRKTAEDNFEYHSSSAIDSVMRDFYVDDMLKSFPTVNQAIEISHDIKNLLSKGGFHLTKWISNSTSVLDSFPSEDQAATKTQTNLGPIDEKTLGLIWDLKTDHLRPQLPKLTYPNTRRGVLATVASVYDPLGIICPLILKAKLINQELCILKTDWDDQIPSEILPRWQQWISELQDSDEYSLPRCFKPSFNYHQVEIHHFSDASEIGYGLVSFIRFIGPHGQTHCSFLYGKSRIKPLSKGITIPKLELNAAVNLVAANHMIISALDKRIEISKITFWTDSMIVLKYIYNETKPLNIFVTNRVAKIRESTSPSQWKHVPSSENPADIASRGLRRGDKNW